MAILTVYVILLALCNCTGVNAAGYYRDNSDVYQDNNDIYRGNEDKTINQIRWFQNKFMNGKNGFGTRDDDLGNFGNFGNFGIFSNYLI